MGLIKKFFSNTSKPRGVGGRVMLAMMNAGHDKGSRWALDSIEVPEDAVVLDIGCGGGRNVSHLLSMASDGKVYGVDYSEQSVRTSLRKNRRQVASGRAHIQQASVSSLPFGDGTFDIVTAFETVYFWPDIVQDFREVRRVMKDGAVFLIANEAMGEKEAGMWTDIIDMHVYSIDELTDKLSQAGFHDITPRQHENGRWFTMTVRR